MHQIADRFPVRARGFRGRALLVFAAALATVVVVACRGGGANPDEKDQVLPRVRPTISASECIDSLQPADAPQFSDVDPSLYQDSQSGIRFYDITPGTGETPNIADAVIIEYTGWLADGCMFDSSYLNEEPFTFPMVNMIRGWVETFQTMKEGGVRVVELPPELAYGDTGYLPRIPSNATLTFHIRFIERLTIAEAQATVAAEKAIATAEAAQAAGTATAVAATSVALGTPLPTATAISAGVSCSTDLQPADAPQFADIDFSRFADIGDGLRIYDINVGDGPSPAATDTVVVHYTGWLLDGCIFDSSYQRGNTVTFSLNQVIPGWQDGMATMKKGGVRLIEIPPAMAYGVSGIPGSIPPNATLVFQVTLVDVPGR